MYTEFYQMTERPFNVTPDPKFLYLNARYREAIASLNYGITQRKGFITLIGEAGTGKTTLLKRLLEDLDPKTKTVFIFNTNVTFEEILEYIFAEFDLAVHNGKKLYMLQRLNTFLLEELRNGGNVALLIDEAQDLEFSVLEDLRLLSNLETAKEKILQIVLSGQPELGQKLSNPILRQLRQRISINCRLLPLSREEITEYLQYRLQAAGCPDLKLFSREAEDRIYHFSRGVPRLVNVVCDNALVIGYALGKKRIGADIIDEAAADLLPVEAIEHESSEPATAATSTSVAVSSSPSSGRLRQRLAVGGLVAAALGVGVLSVGRSGSDAPSAPPAPTVAAQLDVIQPGNPEDRGDGRVAAAPEPAEPVVVPTLALRDPREASLAKPAVAPTRAAAQPSADEILVEEVVEEEAVEPNAAPRVAAAPAERPNVAVPVVERQPDPEPVVEAEPEPEPEPPPTRPAKPKVVAARPPQRELEPPRPTPATVAEAPVPKGALRLDGVPFARMTVQAGDSISGIAQRKYGQATPTILDLLKLANPQIQNIDVIQVGQTIRLPQLSDGFPILNDGSGRYSLLVFTTTEQRRAAALSSALRGNGFEASVARSSLGSRKTLFRVVLPGFGSRDAVAAAGASLQKVFQENAQLAQLTQ